MTDLNDTFQARLERTHCEQDWPCAMSTLAHELGDAYATLTEQVETLTADNAALRVILAKVSQFTRYTWSGHGDDAYIVPTSWIAAARAMIGSAHPGAAMLARYKALEAVERAYEDTSRRLGDAHAYCQKHLMPGAWGRNVWHAILDDAIALRALGQEGGG